MLKFLADEDFNNRIVRGLRRRLLTLDVVRVQEIGLTGIHDPEVLEWAAREGRLVLTHDAATMIDFAYSRIADGLEMPGLIAVSQYLPIGDVIEELIMLAECSIEDEWSKQVLYLPLKKVLDLPLI